MEWMPTALKKPTQRLRNLIFLDNKAMSKLERMQTTFLLKPEDEVKTDQTKY